jgi:hypothetical protein
MPATHNSQLTIHNSKLITRYSLATHYNLIPYQAKYAIDPMAIGIP